MYGRSFEDPDGHIWEVMWMDVEAAAKAQSADRPDRLERSCRCPKYPPACGSTARPRRPRNSMFRCCPIPDRDGPENASTARRQGGLVLVVEFTLAGQRFMALNGGMRFEYTHASRSRSIAPTRPRSIGSGTRCSDGGQADAAAGSGSLRRAWQIVPTALPKYLGGPIGRRAARDAGHAADGQARYRRPEARLRGQVGGVDLSPGGVNN